MSRQSAGNKKPVFMFMLYAFSPNNKLTNTEYFSFFRQEEHAAVQIHRQWVILTPEL